MTYSAKLPANVADYTTVQLVMNLPTECVEVRGNVHELKPIPAEFKRRGGFAQLSDAEWRELLVDGGVIYTRRRWLEGEPLVISIRRTPWLDWSKISVTAVEPDLGSVEADDSDPGFCSFESSSKEMHFRELELAKTPLPQTRRVAFDVNVDIRPAQPETYWSNLGLPRCDSWRGRIELPIESTRDLQSIVKADAGEEVARALRSSITADWWNPAVANSKAVIRVYLNGDTERFASLKHLAFAASVELVHRGEVVSRGNLVVEDSSDHPQSHTFAASTPLDPLPPGLATNSDFAGWEVRITGTSDHALEHWDATRWWSGTFTAPLAELMRSR